MNALQNFLKSFAIGYAVSYIATTAVDKANKAQNKSEPVNNTGKPDHTKNMKFGHMNPDGSFSPK